MKRLIALIPLLCVTSAVLAADEKPSPVRGVILQLNEPGTIRVGLSIGSDDGTKLDDVFDVYRDKKLIGRLTIAEVTADQSVAVITHVWAQEKIKQGDAAIRDVTLQFLQKLRPDSTVKEPAALGRTYAEADISSGFTRILYFGKPWSAGKPLVDDDTGYPVTIAEGCLVTKEFVNFVNEYNAVMRKHSNEK